MMIPPHIEDREAFFQRIDSATEQLQTYRNDMLRQFLLFVSQHSPWHRNRLRHLNLETAVEHDLRSVPPMSKQDLLEHFDAIVTDRALTYTECRRFLETLDAPGKLLHERYRVSVSGGSSGVQAMTVLTAEEGSLQVAALARTLHRWNARAQAWQEQPSFLSITSIKPVYRTQHVINAASGWKEAAVSIEQPIEEIVEAINQFQPDIVSTYPSLLPRLIAAAQAGVLVARPKLILAVAEPLLPEHQRRGEEVLGCPILSGWGATEVGAIGLGSGFDPGMLIFDDLTIVEFVDQNYQPVPPETRCDRVLVTAFHRYTVPMIRYEYTDQLYLHRSRSSCGSAFRWASNVEGRAEDHFQYPGGRVVDANIFREILGREQSIYEYQIHQTPHGAAIRITQSNPVDPARIRQQLLERIKPILGAAADISVQVVPTIERTKGAQKLRRFIPLAG